MRKPFNEYHVSPQAATMNQRPWYVYVLELHDVYGFYTGISVNVLHRIAQHCACMGALVTERFGVRRLHHLELHRGFQVAQFREAYIAAYYRDRGVLSFVNNSCKKGAAERAYRPFDMTRRMVYNEVPESLLEQCHEGEHPLPPPSWDVPAFRSDLTAPVPPIDGLTQSPLL